MDIARGADKRFDLLWPGRRSSVFVMATAKILRVYLDEPTRLRAQAGTFNFFNKLRSAFESRGFRVEACNDSDSERMKSADRRGYTLFHMEEPVHDRALTMRRAYYYPFWRIEASAKRWQWDIATQIFDPDHIDAKSAQRFFRFWRKRLFDMEEPPSRRSGMVYVPLQGRLLERRSFQTLSPIAMIETILQRDTERDIVVGFHPAEAYFHEEIDAVRKLADRTPRMRISAEPMPKLLGACDYVATENSSVALAGYFFCKPALLFARIDFHHIAGYVPEVGVDAALAKVTSTAPAFDKYIYWFLKLSAINAGSDQAEEQILAAVRRHGWQV